ncbi:ATP-binding protein [Streptomyces sp. SID13666]|uniref:ATP-binding protein n=1 Tax=unclassified Streptomyces TaxID=2593676 RepID=UPI0013C14CE2|nr:MULTISPECIES: ATP-binding protein [unclassified Streptomyces]NEA54083.1 ATP-binding protein [Streptomyces sp. SID13666]NEA70180.1 ATP-binding protein [Streptomyces sp. SID13588]
MLTVTAFTVSAPSTPPMPSTSSAPPVLPAPAGAGRARSRPSAPPPPGRALVHWVLSPEVAAVPRIRRRLHRVLLDWHIQADVIDTLLLAVTELAANSVQHAGPATERLRVTAAVGGGRLWLDVSDGDPCPPRVGAAVDPDAECGRGLLMVDLLVDEACGSVEVLPYGGRGTGGGAGKTVRVRVPVAR